MIVTWKDYARPDSQKSNICRIKSLTVSRCPALPHSMIKAGEPVGPENRESLISLRIFRHQSPPLTDSARPQLSISVIVTGRRNQPSEMRLTAFEAFFLSLTEYSPC